MSKGSVRRPENTSKILDNWDKIFGKKKVNLTDLKNVVQTKNKKKNGTKQKTKS